MRLDRALLAGAAPEEVPPPLLRLLCLLDGEEAQRFLAAVPRCSARVRRAHRRFQRGSARLALATWCARHIWLRLESFYQERETQTFARARDPRVPPRVRSYWAERGQVSGARVLLRPSDLPRVYDDAIALRFSGGEQSAQRPMLTNVAQGNRRIYSVVSLIVRTSDDSLSAGETHARDVVVLRKYTYVKEFHEWEPLAPPIKHALDASGALCRHDLVTLDGSVALELDVPSGADAQVDYYLVKGCLVHLHMQEILQRFFATIRPITRLPISQTERRRCRIKTTFRGLDGRMLGRYVFPGELVVEQQQGSAADSSTNAVVAQADEETPSRARVEPSTPSTGIEAFAIITCGIPKPVNPELVFHLPRDPGYCSLQVLDEESRQLYFYTTALHRGAQRDGVVSVLSFRWLPGVLESYPTLDSLHRRTLKGQARLSTHLGNDALHELSIVAQHLTRQTLERYAASIDSHTRPQ